MTFTEHYPYAPPTFKFTRPIYHPNIYADGKLCISILHAPGEDEQSGELASERWSPLQGVESVLRSVLLLLDDPEIGSPANVDAGVMYRDNRAEYDARAEAAVLASKQDIPEGFVMPTTLDEAPPAKIVEDDDFWAEDGSDDDSVPATVQRRIWRWMMTERSRGKVRRKSKKTKRWRLKKNRMPEESGDSTLNCGSVFVYCRPSSVHTLDPFVIRTGSYFIYCIA
jgi:ubiquitin-protein ligase